MTDADGWRKRLRDQLSVRALRRTVLRVVVFAAVAGAGHYLQPAGGTVYELGLVFTASCVARLVGPESLDEPATPAGQYELRLVASGARVRDVVEELRDLFDLSYRAARKLCDDAPSTLRFAADPEVAEATAARLRQAGAYVTWAPGSSPGPRP